MKLHIHYVITQHSNVCHLAIVGANSSIDQTYTDGATLCDLQIIPSDTVLDKKPSYRICKKCQKVFAKKYGKDALFLELI